MTRIIADTGPLVALLNRRDRFHSWARDVFDTVAPPLFTCEAVISEASFLLGKVDGGSDALMTLLARGVVRIDFSLETEVEALRVMMRKYISVPMSIADACLVRMVELEPDSTIVTLDGDFRVYKRQRRQVIPVIMPAGR